MNKKIRKMTLNKETLRNLEDNKLSNVQGGASEAGTCPVISCQVECTFQTRRCSVCCP